MSFGLVRLIGESVDRSRWIGIFSISETVLLDASTRLDLDVKLKSPARSDGRRPAGARCAFFFDLSSGAGLANEGEVVTQHTRLLRSQYASHSRRDYYSRIHKDCHPTGLHSVRNPKILTAGIEVNSKKEILKISYLVK